MENKCAQRYVLWLVLCLPLVSYPLSWLPPGGAQYRFAVALPLAGIAAVAFLFWLGGQAWRGELPGMRRGSLWPVVGVVTSGVLSLRFSQQPYCSVQMLPVLVGNLVIFFVAAKFPEDGLARLSRAWLAAATVVAVNGLARLGIEKEFVSTFGNWNFLAAYLAASVVMALTARTWWSLALAGLFLVALWVCGSRGAWLALAICGAAFGITQAPGKWRIPLAIVTGLAVLSLGVWLVGRWRTRDVRPVIWEATARMIAARPVLGHGLGTFVIEYPEFRSPEYFTIPKAGNLTDHAHNELLETAAEQGFLGLGATLCLWGVALWSGARKARTATVHRGLWWGFTGALAVLIVHGMVDVDLRYAPNQQLLWLLMGLLVSVEHERSVTLQSRVARIAICAGCLTGALWMTKVGIINPTLASISERQARLAEQRGDLAAAIAAADRSLQSQPFRFATRYYLAGLYWKTQTPEGRARAIDESLKLQALAPDYADITFNLGRLYLADARPREALPYLKRAVTINPYSIERRQVLEATQSQLGL